MCGFIYPAKQEQVGVEGLIRSQRLRPGGRRAPSTQRASPRHQGHSCRFDTAPVITHSGLVTSRARHTSKRLPENLCFRNVPEPQPGRPWPFIALPLHPGRAASLSASAWAYF